MNDIATWATQEFHLIRPPDISTISRILKRKDYWESAAADGKEAKRIRTLNHPELDTALIHFVLDCQQHCILLNGPLIVKKVHQLAEYLDITDAKFSHGWLDRFQNRHGLKLTTIHGESGDAAVIGATELQEWTGKLARWAPEDGYNLDETGLFWQMAPDKTIATRQIEGSKKEKKSIYSNIDL